MKRRNEIARCPICNRRPRIRIHRHYGIVSCKTIFGKIHLGTEVKNAPDAREARKTAIRMWNDTANAMNVLLNERCADFLNHVVARVEEKRSEERVKAHYNQH